jgi:hypothetical protein
VKRALATALILGALAPAACKRKVALVKTPVSQIAPIGGGAAPVAPQVEDSPSTPAQLAARPASPTDALPAAPVPAAKPAMPSVANPYITPPGQPRLPMYKQRAKFF